MGDAELRRLQREARGDPAAEGRYLLRRVRTGELSPEGLELLAYAGHAGAVAALGEERPAAPSDLPTWTRGLARWGAGPCLRAARALALAVLPTFEAARPHERALRDALNLVDRGLTGEDAERAELRRRTGRVHQVCARVIRDAPGSPAARAAAAFLYGLQAMAALARGEQAQPAATPQQAALWAATTAAEARHALEPGRLRDAVLEALTRWTLGT